MIEETTLATIEQKPAEVVTRGREAAKQLTAIVSSRAKKLELGGKQYLFFEDWQTIGKFYGVTAKVIATEEVREGESLMGFLAHAVAIANGEEVSGADAECTHDEPNWAGKPRYQLRSMAQTRACAKALRNCLGWVAVLAGYEPTPAEEMTGDNVVRQPDAPATPAQLKKIYAVSKERGYDPDLATSIMIRKFDKGHSKDLTKAQASEFIELLSQGYGLATEEAQGATTGENIPL